MNKWREKKWFRIASSKYVLAGLFFALWMIFLDANSILIHRELNKEIRELEEGIEFYERELEKDHKALEELTSDPEMLEKFAREQYRLKKKNEDIYLIELEDEEKYKDEEKR